MHDTQSCFQNIIKMKDKKKKKRKRETRESVIFYSRSLVRCPDTDTHIMNLPIILSSPQIGWNKRKNKTTGNRVAWERNDRLMHFLDSRKQEVVLVPDLWGRERECERKLEGIGIHDKPTSPIQRLTPNCKRTESQIVSPALKMTKIQQV